jgi:hypothetical protein
MTTHKLRAFPCSRVHSARNINRPNTRRDVSGVRHAVFTTQGTQLSCFRQTQLKSKDSKNKSASALAVRGKGFYVSGRLEKIGWTCKPLLAIMCVCVTLCLCT